MQTYDGQSIIIFDEIVFGDYIYPMSTTTSFSEWSSIAPIFMFDSDGNVIVLINYYSQPADNTHNAKPDPSGVNKYDPATNTFQLFYWMVQPNAVSAAPYYRTHMVETYAFLGDLD